MFAVISRMVKRIKITVDLEVKTKNPMVKEDDPAFNQLCVDRLGIARPLLPFDVALLECVMGRQ